MVVRRKGFRRGIDALAEVFRFLEDFVDEAVIDDRTAFTINLVVEELFTNMVRHNTGGGDQIAVSLERAGDRLHVEIVDSDVDEFDPAAVPKPAVTAGIEDRRPGGLGLHLVQTMVDELEFEYAPETRQMRVSVTKRLEK